MTGVSLYCSGLVPHELNAFDWSIQAPGCASHRVPDMDWLLSKYLLSDYWDYSDFMLVVHNSM